MDALTRDARDDWVAAFEALRFNCIIAALQRNDSAVTTVFQFESDAESCSALCGAECMNISPVTSPFLPTDGQNPAHFPPHWVEHGAVNRQFENVMVFAF